MHNRTVRCDYIFADKNWQDYNVLVGQLGGAPFIIFKKLMVVFLWRKEKNLSSRPPTTQCKQRLFSDCVPSNVRLQPDILTAGPITRG